MKKSDRFKIRRALLHSRGLCERCGAEKAMPGKTYGILCATEIKAKRLLAPARLHRCEKIARLERVLAFCDESKKAVLAELQTLRAG